MAEDFVEASKKEDIAFPLLFYKKRQAKNPVASNAALIKV